MPKIAVDDAVLEALAKASRTLVEIAGHLDVSAEVQGVAVSAYAALERMGSVFLEDGRLGPDVERALLWVDRSHIEAHDGDAADEAVLGMLNGDWDGLGEEAYSARDALVASVAERNAPSTPAA
jgi:hypothetical protein